MELDDLRVLVNKRQRAAAERDAAEDTRKECDEQLKPELALRGGNIALEDHTVGLVDRETESWDKVKLRQTLISMGVSMDIIEAAVLAARKVSFSTSVSVRARKA